MGTLKIFSIFTAHNHNHPTQSDLFQVSLLIEPRAKWTQGINSWSFPAAHVWKENRWGIADTARREGVLLVIYALALSEKDLVFEYVSSTERGLSLNEAERRLRENGPNILHEYNFPRWGHLLWSALFHPFNIILIFLSAISYITSDSPNGCIMLVLVVISVSLRFYQEYSSSKAIIKLSELVRCPVRVQRSAGRVVQGELIVQVDQRDVVLGDIIYFEPDDFFPW